MAVGDIVTGFVNSGSLTFQPAAGVSILLTGCYGQTGNVYQTNGAASAFVLYDYVSGNANRSYYPVVKFFINNTHYLNIGGTAGQPKGYCGIQVA